MNPKFEIIFIVRKADFSRVAEKHYTTLERLMSGDDTFPYNDVEVMAKRMFTGSFDMNGKEIYSGDIIPVTYSNNQVINEVVIYNKDRFDLTWNGGRFGRAGSLLQTSKFEVIGNKYQNPELCPQYQGC